jgi:sigma-B regulation protein RsbU (phosphoserine phosphatase)
MARRPVPRPAVAPQPTPRELLLHSWPGRIFIAAAAAKFVFAIWRTMGELPAAARLVSSGATIALALALGVFLWRLFVKVKRRLLWRVRRKLILSYIFIGVIPSLLTIVFFLFAGSLVFMNVSAYLFIDAYDKVTEDGRISAQAAATAIARTPSSVNDTIERVHGIRSSTYPAVSVAFLKPDGTASFAGPWKPLPLPAGLPPWMAAKDQFQISIGVPVKESPGEEELVVRTVVKVGPGGSGGAIVIDIPLDDQVLHQLYSSTGVRLENVFDSRSDLNQSVARAATSRQGSRSVLFEKSLAQIDVTDWATGDTHRDTLALAYRLGELYKHLASAQAMQFGTMRMRLSDALLVFLVVIGVLFLIIEAAALTMGLALARSITSSVHELFMGTERVQQGDFTHRISIESKDQLGELADSFNQMTGSIENLMQTAAEKKRLEEELRIARQIQMSLLPRGPLEFGGLGITALCVPAREVGGDYYDFFPLSSRRLGVLIADVSGKGTSAALYMAELKGLVLSLSQIYQSPRQLLIEVNRIISDNLDTRSFITMTYAVLDLDEATMTFARAGHTPVVFLQASGAGGAQSLVPSGLVVGLRIPGAQEKFMELLEEQRIDLRKGDVIALYTDGITEAMNARSDLFGDARLSRLVAEHGQLEAADLRERILREIEAFVGQADQHDDMTMILIKVEEAVAATARVAV